MPKVSLITLNYNGKNVLKNCIESVLKNCKDTDWEWIIAENGSNDGSLEYLESLRHPRIKIVKRKNEGNFSSMNNELTRYATGEYFCFLNNDTEAKDNFLKGMLKIIENDPKVGVVGPTLVYPNGHLQSAGILIENNLSPINVSVHAINNRPIHPSINSYTREFQAVTAACCMIRKKDFEWVWGFDANYNWAYEDVDLCLKVKYHMGKKIVCTHTTKVIHHESFSKANPNIATNFNFFKNRWESVLEKDVDLYGTTSARIYQKANKTSELTFIVCTHNLKLLNECTIASLLDQEKQNYDLKIIYNFDNRFTAAKALNYGINKSETEFMVLCHHDVIFNSQWTQQFFKEVAKYQGFGVAGLAGVKRAPRVPCGVPVDPSDDIYVNCYGEVTYPYKGNQVHKYGQFPDGKVEIVDELAIILKKSNGLTFDEKTLTNFHFYGPDICLQSLSKGYFNAILNCPAYHKSDGSSSLTLGMDVYWKEFKKLHAKWKKRFPVVITTTGFWNGEKVRTFIENEVPAAKKTVETVPTEPNKSSNINNPLELTVSEAQRFHVSNHLRGSQINWFLNNNKLPHDKDTYVFEALSKGTFRLSATFVDLTGRLTRHDWNITVNPKIDANYTAGMQQNFHTHTFGDIVNGKKISQEFICDIDKLSRVDLFLGTFKRRNVGNLCLAIKNSVKGDILRYTMIPCETIIDGDWNSFNFEPIIDSKNKKFVITVETKDSLPNAAPTAYYIHHSFPFGNLYYNDRKISGCLSFRLFYKK